MYYPVMLNIEGRKIAVVGGGEVACRKVKDLLGAGAEVLVIAPEIHPEIEKMAGEMPDRLALRRRPYERGDIEGVSLVFSAADDSVVNAAVYAEAFERNIFINAVDDPGNCSFIVPSTIRRGTWLSRSPHRAHRRPWRPESGERSKKRFPMKSKKRSPG